MYYVLTYIWYKRYIRVHAYIRTYLHTYIHIRLSNVCFLFRDKTEMESRLALMLIVCQVHTYTQIQTLRI